MATVPTGRRVLIKVVKQYGPHSAAARLGIGRTLLDGLLTGGILRARTVLVVDDDPDQLAMLALLLREGGHRVQTATNPLYALTLATEFNADVVLLDIGLPIMSGYEVLTRLKRHFPRARFYAITGRSQEESRSKATEAGFDGYFAKPLDFAVIEKVLEG
jgi:CheY-like chemotaxis protein